MALFKSVFVLNESNVNHKIKSNFINVILEKVLSYKTIQDIVLIKITFVFNTLDVI